MAEQIGLLWPFMGHRAVREPQVGDTAAALGWGLVGDAKEDLLRLKIFIKQKQMV